MLLQLRRYTEWYVGCFSLICQYFSLYLELTVQFYNIGPNGNRRYLGLFIQDYSRVLNQDY